MAMTKEELMKWVEQVERERMLQDPPPPRPPPERPTIHYTELPEDTRDDQIARDWNFYRREVGRLLAEGHEGKWVLIKGEEIVGIWDTREQAEAVALERYLMEPVLLQQILTREPVRGPIWFCQCRS
jgi:hypothetical protein